MGNSSATEISNEELKKLQQFTSDYQINVRTVKINNISHFSLSSNQKTVFIMFNHPLF
jgi:hypothetical protein